MRSSLGPEVAGFSNQRKDSSRDGFSNDGSDADGPHGSSKRKQGKSKCLTHFKLNFWQKAFFKVLFWFKTEKGRNNLMEGKHELN